MPKTSIIASVRDRLEVTKLCLSAVLVNTEDVELVIVDNGSGPATRAYLEALADEHDNVTLVRSDTNLGFAAACNAGVRASDHDLICLLHNDTVPQPAWLDRMHDAFTDGVGIVGARLLSPVDTIQHAGIDFADDMRSYHRFRDHPGDMLECGRLEKVPAVTAACLLTSRKIYDEVDGMDEGFVRSSYADADFNLKVRDNGYSVVYQPSALAYHLCNLTDLEDVEAGLAATDVDWRLYSARWSERQDMATV